MFRCFDPDGLNQLSTVNGTSAAYDMRGNMTTDPATAKTYSYLKTNNQLATVAAPFTSLAYDALDRLWHVETPAVTNYVSDGTDTIAEYDGSNVLQKRYAFDGTGWPVVQYDAAGTRTWMLPDERGSMVALANDTAGMTSINTYDEYGIPGPTNAGMFQYASMMWLSRAGLYAPTFRAYAAHLGRFNQTDPIGMAGGINLYNYTGNNPVNAVDPLGLWPTWCQVGDSPWGRCPPEEHDFGFGGGAFGGGGNAAGGGEKGGGGRDEKGRDNQSCTVKRDGFVEDLSAVRSAMDVIGSTADLVAITAGAASILFPPAATVAIGAKAISAGSTVLGAMAAAEQTYLTEDYNYIGSAGVQVAGGLIGGKIASNAAGSLLARSQLRIAGRYGPNALRAYEKPLTRAGTNLGSAVTGISICR